MNPHELIRYYFECLSEMGEQMSFDLIKKNKEGVKTLSFNHLTYDGVSALTEHLASLPGEHKIPELNYTKPPSFFKRLLLLTRWWCSVAYWPFYRPKGEARGEHLFDSRVIHLVNEKNLNARILKGLHEALGTQKTTLWMLPVSLHENIHLGMAPLNNVSFIDVKVKTTDTAQDVKAKIHRELKLKSYWGTIYSMSVTRILGKEKFKKAFPYFRFFLKRTGTFTNLGKWEVAGLSEHESWGIKATVVPLNPLGASALQVNNLLTLGLQTHPSLGLDKDDLKHILDQWQKAVQSQ